MRTGKLFLLGLGAGSGATFFFDPQKGVRRRALVRDKWIHVAGELRAQVDAGLRDLSHRTQGAVSAAAGYLRGFMEGAKVSDDILQARVRSALGHVCSHPHAIEVAVEQGAAELSGMVLRGEHLAVVHKVARVHGVILVKDRLEVHGSEDAIPMLQGPPRKVRPAVVRGLSSPAARLVLGSAAALVAGTVMPLLWLPMGTLIGFSLASRTAEQAKVRRARSLERRGARRSSPRGAAPVRQAPSMRDVSSGAGGDFPYRGPVGSANGHPVGASPTGQTRPVPPKPQ